MVSWILAEGKTLRDKRQFITAIAVARVSAFLLVSRAPVPTRQEEGVR